jgi:hypothetical protein
VIIAQPFGVAVSYCLAAAWAPHREWHAVS